MTLLYLTQHHLSFSKAMHFPQVSVTVIRRTEHIQLLSSQYQEHRQRGETPTLPPPVCFHDPRTRQHLLSLVTSGGLPAVFFFELGGSRCECIVVLNMKQRIGDFMASFAFP